MNQNSRKVVLPCACVLTNKSLCFLRRNKLTIERKSCVFPEPSEKSSNFHLLLRCLCDTSHLGKYLEEERSLIPFCYAQGDAHFQVRQNGDATRGFEHSEIVKVDCGR